MWAAFMYCICTCLSALWALPIYPPPQHHIHQASPMHPTIIPEAYPTKRKADLGRQKVVLIPNFSTNINYCKVVNLTPVRQKCDSSQPDSISGGGTQIKSHRPIVRGRFQKLLSALRRSFAPNICAIKKLRKS